MTNDNNGNTGFSKLSRKNLFSNFKAQLPKTHASLNEFLFYKCVDAVKGLDVDKANQEAAAEHRTYKGTNQPVRFEKVSWGYAQAKREAVRRRIIALAKFARDKSTPTNKRRLPIDDTVENIEKMSATEMISKVSPRTMAHVLENVFAEEMRVLGNTPFTGTTTSFVSGTYQNTFTNTVQFVVLDNGPDVCESVIDALANGRFVMILENTFKGLNKESNKGDAAFQIYGYTQGLAASAIENDKYSEDTNGGWLVTLQETKASKSGMFLYKSDYATTKKMFETLTDKAV